MVKNNPGVDTESFVGLKTSVFVSIGKPVVSVSAFARVGKY